MPAPKTNLKWPGDKPIAVVVNLCLESWSDGKASGISPMGNPLPQKPGVVDYMAISWARYGERKGTYRLLEIMAEFDVSCSATINGIIAERAPDLVREIGDAGHEIVGHSYAMDVIPAMLEEADEREVIKRTTELLKEASQQDVVGWLSPRGTPSGVTPKLLAEQGYTWYGDVFDDDIPYPVSIGGKTMVAIPLTTDVNDMPSMKYGHKPADLLGAFDDMLSVCRENETGPMMIDVTMHAHIFGRPRGAYYFKEILRQATAADDVTVMTKKEIAEAVLAAAD